MSAAVLREAAALMRERADRVEPGPWEAGERCVWAPTLSPSHTLAVVADGEAGDGGCVDTDTADHIASWHPAVALAVADWLDDMARLYEHGDSGGQLIWNHALAVARAYLGSAR